MSSNLTKMLNILLRSTKVKNVIIYKHFRDFYAHYFYETILSVHHSYKRTYKRTRSMHLIPFIGRGAKRRCGWLDVDQSFGPFQGPDEGQGTRARQYVVQGAQKP